MKKTFTLCFALLSFLFSQSQIRYLKGSLQGSQETPPNTEKGSGVVIVKYDMGTKALELFGDYAGLTTAINGSHIHIGKPGVAGPIAVPLLNTGDTTGTLSVAATLTQGQEDSLIAGNMYANVHTAAHGAGELRAQLTLTNENTTFLSGKLQGAQATPPNASKATGSVYAIIDMVTDSMFVTGNYTGLTTASNDAHVHLEAPGAPGSIMFPVYHSFATAGALHAVTAVSKVTDALAISQGNTYVNVHTSTYPNGEIRGQLLNSTGMRYFAGNMAGVNEVPPNSSAARGTVIVVYNTGTNELRLAGDYQNLSAVVTVAHIHVAAPGVVGPPVIQLATSGDSTGTLVVVDTLTDAQETDLLAGNMYVNVHSGTYTEGEIRAQLVATTAGETHLFAVNLFGTQEVPANNSTAVGSALIIVDKTTGQAYVTSAFSGINSGATAGHIHRGPVGVAGPVILPLNVANVTRTKAGTVSGSGILSASLVDSMINGLTYINIHSPQFPDGAIRGQLGDLVLPLKLTYFNAYKQRNEIELIWETSEEVNVSSYEIEQLNIATKNWIAKGTVAAHGGNSAAKYSYTDIPNLYGSAFAIYRLKMTDKDGKVTYSSIVKLNYDKLKAELFIQTNPVTTGELRYTITGLTTGKKAEVSIIDYNGRLIMRNTISSLMNNTLKIPHLSAGMYKLVVRVDDTMLQQSFIK